MASPQKNPTMNGKTKQAEKVSARQARIDRTMGDSLIKGQNQDGGKITKKVIKETEYFKENGEGSW